MRIDLGKFFAYTGMFLIIVAGGVLAYGVHDLQEAGFLPGLRNLAFDVSAAVPPDSWYGTLLKGTVNFSPATTWLQAVVWVGYVVPVTAVFVSILRRHRPAAVAEPPAPAPPAPTSAAANLITGRTQ